MFNIAIFASGSGTNAENIALYFSRSSLVKVSLILSNKADAYVHKRAKKLAIPSYSYNKAEFDDGLKVLTTLCNHRIDFIVLAGFLLKVSEPILNAYPDSIVNIHPALLPKYGGRGMYGDNVHRAVKESGDTQSGITIHYVNENYDEGDIIFQAGCNLSSNDTIDDIASKVHALEYKYYPAVIESLVEKLAVEKQKREK